MTVNSVVKPIKLRIHKTQTLKTLKGIENDV